MKKIKNIIIILIVFLFAMSMQVSSTQLMLPSGNNFNINIITSTTGNGTGWNQTGKSLYPSDATTNLQVQTLAGSGTSCLQTDATGLISTTGSLCSGGSSTFNLGNISNYSQFVKSIDFNLGNISNYTQFVKSTDFNRGNISNNTAWSNIYAFPINCTGTNFVQGSAGGTWVCTAAPAGTGGSSPINSSGNTYVFNDTTASLFINNAINLTAVGNIKLNGTLYDNGTLLTINNLNAFFNLGNYSTEYASTGFKIGNLTAQPLFNLGNYSSEYSNSGYKNGNFTTQYDARADRFVNGNFTTLYDNRADRFGLGNYSAEYASTGFKAINFSSLYGTEYGNTGYKLANFSSNYGTEYASTGYKLGNATASGFVQGKDFNIGNISNDSMKASNNASIALWNRNGLNTVLRNSADFVGIGTNSPLSLLHLNISDNSNISATNILTLTHVIPSSVNSTGGIGVSILFRAADNASQLYKIGNISAILYNSTNGSQLGALTFSTSGSDTGDLSLGHSIERMRIDGKGRVGINTTTPSETLTVNGNFSTTSTNISLGSFYVGQYNASCVGFGFGNASQGIFYCKQ